MGRGHTKHWGRSVLAIILPLAMALAASRATAQSKTDAAAEAGAASQGEIPAAQIPKAIANALNSPDRPAADRELDAGRHFDQVLAFFGIAPGIESRTYGRAAATRPTCWRAR